jgi:hypothetical protein
MYIWHDAFGDVGGKMTKMMKLMKLMKRKGIPFGKLEKDSV